MTEEERQRFLWIQDNLTTRSDWTLKDYEEFYERDVIFLRDLVIRQEAQITDLEKALRRPALEPPRDR